MKQTSERLGVKIVGGLKGGKYSMAGSSLLIDLFRKLEIDRIAIRYYLLSGHPRIESRTDDRDLYLIKCIGGEKLTTCSISGTMPG